MNLHECSSVGLFYGSPEYSAPCIYRKRDLVSDKVFACSGDRLIDIGTEMVATEWWRYCTEICREGAFHGEDPREDPRTITLV